MQSEKQKGLSPSRVLGQRLRELRRERKLSVRDVASAVGVAASTYRDWEEGRLIRGEPYVKLAQAFGVTLAYLMTGEDISSARQELLAELRQLRQATESLERRLGALL